MELAVNDDENEEYEDSDDDHGYDPICSHPICRAIRQFLHIEGYSR